MSSLFWMSIEMRFIVDIGLVGRLLRRFRVRCLHRHCPRLPRDSPLRFPFPPPPCCHAHPSTSIGALIPRTVWALLLLNSSRWLPLPEEPSKTASMRLIWNFRPHSLALHLYLREDPTHRFSLTCLLARTKRGTSSLIQPSRWWKVQSHLSQNRRLWGRMVPPRLPKDRSHMYWSKQSADPPP